MDDKFELLKKQRALRSRSRPAAVEKTWARIDRDENLSVKEKLEKLIRLTGGGKEKRPVQTVEPQPRESLLFLENPYTYAVKYGKTGIGDGLSIPGDILYLLSRDAGFRHLDLSTALFIDLETTGLAGGTGTLPFLVGMGYYRNDRFNVAQYFLGEPAEEDRMIRELGQFFQEMGFQSVVTYNGKAFDLPLLETRFVMSRRPFGVSSLPHLDLLFAARHLWKHKHESCRLAHLAQQIVAADRAEDIPSSEIPYIYSRYLDTGDFSLVEPILYHNQEDILSLLGLVIAAAKLFVEDRAACDEGFDALDMVGVGKVLKSTGNLEKWVAYSEMALGGRLPGELAKRVKVDLSDHFKKTKDWQKAVSLWQDLSATDQSEFRSFRELAIHFEHREKDYEAAMRVVRDGLALAMTMSEKYRRDFEHRLVRLRAKIEHRDRSRIRRTE
jgi:uncharacterized protein YprB with RNaseH-like and TPR domain